MTHPGGGPISALATEVFLGDPARFANSKELASYTRETEQFFQSRGKSRKNTSPWPDVFLLSSPPDYSYD